MDIERTNQIFRKYVPKSQLKVEAIQYLNKREVRELIYERFKGIFQVVWTDRNVGLEIRSYDNRSVAFVNEYDFIVINEEFLTVMGPEQFRRSFKVTGGGK